MFICWKLLPKIFVYRLKIEILITCDISVHQLFMFLTLCLQLKWREKVHSVVEGKASVFPEFIYRSASSKNIFPGKKREEGKEVSNNCLVYQLKTNSDIYAAYKHKYLKIYYVSQVKISNEAYLLWSWAFLGFCSLLGLTVSYTNGSSWKNEYKKEWECVKE